MAAPVDRFYTPEQDFEGLYRLGQKLETNRLREQQRADREQARMASTGKFLADYLDPKEFLTGTYYDPQILKGFNDLLVEGADLERKGADPIMLMIALAPKVNRLSQYSTKAKMLGENLKKQMSLIKPNMGYDIPKLEQEARRAAFFDEKGQLKDINTVDPEVDWVSETIKMFPEKVTTDAGIDEFVKSSPKFVNTKDVTRYTPRGGMERSKVKVTAPNWLIPDIDEKGVMTDLVPRYQIAIDGGNPVMHEFTNEKGQKVQAPVRVLDENEYKSILSSNPGIADWVRGQVKLANPDIDLNSPQANLSARAILYNELKRRRPGGIEDIEITKPPQIKISTGSGGGKSAIRDIADYDIIGAYQNKIRPFTIRVKKGIWGKEDETVDVILASDIDVNDKKLFGDVKPYRDETGREYYKVLDGLDLEGKNGQIIYRSKVAQANLDKTALNEVSRGRLELKPNAQVDLKTLDPNGFKKEGKYWRYKDGRLFDDSGNLIKK